MNEKIKKLMNKEYGVKLDFTPIKTHEDFHKNYKMHDIASNFLLPKLIKIGYEITPLGKDLRDLKVIMKNEMPDFHVENKNKEFAFDIKSKASEKYFGWVNQRAVNGYRNFIKETGIPVFAFFVLVKNNLPVNKIGYSDISRKEINAKKAWNGNLVYIFKWKYGFPFE